MLLVLHIEGCSEPAMPVPQQDEVATEHRGKTAPRSLVFACCCFPWDNSRALFKQKGYTTLEWNNSAGNNPHSKDNHASSPNTQKSADSSTTSAKCTNTAPA